jgi:ATP-dependent Clp protease, protease subunit
MTGQISGRYIIPSFTERTSYGIREMNPYNKLFEERVIFLGAQIDDTSANDIIAQLFTLETVNPDADISIYINSPGGAYTSMTAIYDTMQFVCCDIQTVCVGQARSAAAILLAAGAQGKRIALPHSRIVLEQPTIASEYGQASDIEIQSMELLRMRDAMEKLLAAHSGRSEEEVRKDMERERYLPADAAKEYGIIDAVVTGRDERVPASVLR